MLAALTSTLLLWSPIQDPQDARLDFDLAVRPLLADRCFACHGPDANRRKADLRFDRRDDALADRDGHAAIVPGNPAASALVARIFAADPDERMPPPDSGLSLTEDERNTLRQWIADGAAWGEHWSFVAPVRPAVPGFATHPIDAFVRARLAGLEMEPAPEATRTELLRRVTFDLTGLPPTLADVDAFLADAAADAFERVVDRLLASPAYGEHQARAWLDAARYADTNGYQGDLTRTMWPWRDQVIEALNANMPFDRFTTLQLAGDLLPAPSRSELIATGFHRNHMLNGEGGRIAEESRVEYVVDRVNTTATVWLGLTLGCAQCHDHKYDPITQREYYRLYAFFDNIDESGGVDAGGNANPVLQVPTAEQTATLAALERERDRVVAAGQGAAESWTPLVPIRLTTVEPVTIEQLADGSTLISGANPDRNDYEVVTEPGSTPITALRLEALAHDSFTNGYLARSDSGNFVLTGIEVEITPPDGTTRAVAIADASADYTQHGFDVRQTLDDDDDTGWAVHGDTAFQPHRAVFVLAEPLIVEPGARLTVRLEHRSRHRFHNLGRFRLSVTGEPTPPQPDPALIAELAAIRERIAAVEASVVSTMILRERAEPRTTHVLVRGRYDQPDGSEVLSPGVPAVMPPLPSDGSPDGPADRLALARWLVAPDHPLTARVTVNRYWQQFFGRGLVKTVEDFGVQGDRPSHPALLDWLAREFIDSGWNVKAMHRLIVTSATYRQSAHVDAAALELDPDNRWLGRGPRRRLSSFVIRDQALALSGLLVDRVGGPPVRPYQPAGVWAEATFGTITFVQDHGERLYRRSLYTFWRRIVGPTGLFDTGARQICEVRREPTNTPLHALVTLNDVTYVEAARVLATRLLQECRTPDERITRAFRLATARPPDDDERRILMRAYAGFLTTFRADETEAGLLLAASGEWPVESSLEPVELAAWTQLCHLILNLDEVLSTN